MLVLPYGQPFQGRLAMRSPEFSKMLASLAELNLRQLAVLAGHVDALNGQREVQGLVEERLKQWGACPTA